MRGIASTSLSLFPTLYPFTQTKAKTFVCFVCSTPCTLLISFGMYTAHMPTKLIICFRLTSQHWYLSSVFYYFCCLFSLISHLLFFSLKLLCFFLGFSGEQSTAGFHIGDAIPDHPRSNVFISSLSFQPLRLSPLSFSSLLFVLTNFNVLGPNISSKSSSNLTAVNSSPFHLQFGGLANAVRVFFSPYLFFQILIKATSSDDSWY
jgi:hypothetical protein